MLEKYATLFLHVDNPLSCILELMLYLSIGYLLAAKGIRSVLKKISLKQHARDRCTEATLLGVSSAVCMFLCWTELRPRRDVHRRENNLASVFTQNRLFDEHSGFSTNNRQVFTAVSALLLHSTGVLWCSHGTNLQVVKKTCFFAFYVAAYNLRFKSLGPAATLLVSLTEVLLQLTRVICCFERKSSHTSELTTLGFVVYLTAWSVVFVWFLPWSLVHLCLYRDWAMPKMPPLCFLCGSLFIFNVVEVLTMPLLKILMQYVLPTYSLVLGGRLESVLIPPPPSVLQELRELQARKLQAKVAQKEFDKRHGSNKKTRDAYKSFKMIMAVKRRIRKFQQEKLLNAVPFIPEVHRDPSDNLEVSPSINSCDTVAHASSDISVSEPSDDLEISPPIISFDSDAHTTSDISVSEPSDDLEITAPVISFDSDAHTTSDISVSEPSDDLEISPPIIAFDSDAHTISDISVSESSDDFEVIPSMNSCDTEVRASSDIPPNEPSDDLEESPSINSCDTGAHASSDIPASEPSCKDEVPTT